MEGTLKIASHKEAWVLVQALAEYMMKQHHKGRTREKNDKWKGMLKEQSKIAQALKDRVIDECPKIWIHYPLKDHLPLNGPEFIKDWPEGEDCDG